MTEYFKIGKFVAVYGLKGELILQHSLGQKTALKDLKALFTEDGRDRFLPWFIESARIKSPEEIYIQIQDIGTREKAQRLAAKEVWLSADDFHRYSARTAPISMLGFHVIDQNKDLGPILEVIEQPHQILCRIEMEGKEVLIPLNEQTIGTVDRKKKQVLVNLPDGLLDVYLGL